MPASVEADQSAFDRAACSYMVESRSTTARIIVIIVIEWASSLARCSENAERLGRQWTTPMACCEIAIEQRACGTFESGYQAPAVRSMEESTLDELQLIQRDHLVELERLRVLCFQESLAEDGAGTDNRGVDESAWLEGFQAGMRLGELAGKAYAYRSWVLASSPAWREEHSSERASPGRGTGLKVPAFTVESAAELERLIDDWTAFCAFWQFEWDRRSIPVHKLAELSDSEQ